MMSKIGKIRSCQDLGGRRRGTEGKPLLTVMRFLFERPKYAKIK